LFPLRIAQVQPHRVRQKPPFRPVEDTWHGHKIVDNYRWLEDGTTPQTKEMGEG